MHFNTDLRMIKRIAKQYRDLHGEYTIRLAVHKAYEAYDLFKTAEIAMIDDYYSQPEYSVRPTEKDYNAFSMRY